DVLCLVSGVLALTSIVEPRSFAHRVCAALGSVHGAIVIMYFGIPDILTGQRFGVSPFDVGLSAAVAVSCWFVIRRATPLRRFWIRSRFDDRLAGPHRPYLTIEE